MGALLLLCVLLVCSAGWASSGPHPRVTVVVANRLLLSDLADSELPTISEMMRYGAVGLISPNCVGAKTEASVMLTANAGCPAKGGAFAREFYDWNELLPDGTLAGAAYAIRTGRNAPKGSAVFLGLGQALRENAKYSVVPPPLGALGDALNKAGRRTLVLGNADVREPGVGLTPDRSAAVLAMDGRGQVGYSHLSRTPNPAPDERTRIPDLTIICFGASVKLDEERISISDTALAAQRARMLRSLDSILQTFSRLNDTIILVSFSPPSGLPWDQLTPIVIYNARDHGMLTSASTRTPGIIAAADFAPTVLKLMDVPRTDAMIGRPASVVRQGGVVAALEGMSTRVTSNRRLLLPLGVFLATLGALSFTGTALVVAFGLKVSAGVLRLLRIGMVASACVAGALYLASLAPAGMVGYLAGTASALVALTALSMGLTWSFRRDVTNGKLPAVTACAAAFFILCADALVDCPDCMPGARVIAVLLIATCLGLAASFRTKATIPALPVVLAFGFTSLMVLVDAFTGCRLCKFCGVSSYYISGMRFYGIGNEFAGVLIGMGSVAALFLRERRWVAAVVGLITVVALGSGSFGANYGGTAAAVVTFVLLWLALSRGQFGARHVVLALAAAVAVVVACAVIDWHLSGGSGSHAARAAGLAERIGHGFLWDTVIRKVGFNLKTTYTIGLRVFLVFVPFLALWFWKLRDKARGIYKDDPRVMAGVKAILWGSGAAFLFNDSGIVSASVMVAMVVLVLLYSLLEELRAEG